MLYIIKFFQKFFNHKLMAKDDCFIKVKLRKFYSLNFDIWPKVQTNLYY